MSRVQAMDGRISDNRGNWIRVDDFRQLGSYQDLPSHMVSALWAWSDRRKGQVLPSLDNFDLQTLKNCGADDRAHVFDTRSSDPMGYFMTHRSKVGNVADRIDAVGLPLKAWLFKAQTISHAAYFYEVVATRMASVQRVVRVYDGLPQTYLRVLCPLSENGHDVTEIVSVVALQKHAVPPRLVHHSTSVDQGHRHSRSTSDGVPGR